MVYATHHAIERIWHRYGLEPSESDWRDAFLDIVDGRSLLLAAISEFSERRIVRVAGKAVHVIYKPHAAKIITVLPPGVRKGRHYYD